MTEISVDFGPQAEPLSTQLAKQGMALRRVDFYQQCADAITLLRMRGFVLKDEADAMRKKLWYRMQHDLVVAVRND